MQLNKLKQKKTTNIQIKIEQKNNHIIFIYT